MFKCCSKFEEEYEAEQIEKDNSSSGWHVNGCCGGGCYVLTDIKYCPFCGKSLD